MNTNKQTLKVPEYTLSTQNWWYLLTRYDIEVDKKRQNIGFSLATNDDENLVFPIVRHTGKEQESNIRKVGLDYPTTIYPRTIEPALIPHSIGLLPPSDWYIIKRDGRACSNNQIHFRRNRAFHVMMSLKQNDELFHDDEVVILYGEVYKTPGAPPRLTDCFVQNKLDIETECRVIYGYGGDDFIVLNRHGRDQPPTVESVEYLRKNYGDDIPDKLKDLVKLVRYAVIAVDLYKTDYGHVGLFEYSDEFGQTSVCSKQLSTIVNEGMANLISDGL